MAIWRGAVLAAALCIGMSHAAAVPKRGVSPKRMAERSKRSSQSVSSLESISRFKSLDSRLRRQLEVVERLEERVADLERSAPKEFEILHYNILANASGTNMLPWFCYGANVSSEERAELHRRFYAPGEDGMKRHPTKGWPRWAEGVLSAERMRAIERYDAAYFAWEKRRERLWAAVSTHLVGCRTREPDIITLAELDCYGSFWRERLREGGYDSAWRKRPRDCSPDGCCIAWRSATFELVATGGYDFGVQLNKPPDRVCLFALLRWRRDPSVQLIVATTHLQRDPESELQQLARGFQYGAIFRKLLSFASAHGAEDAPVVLSGDLNSKDCDELAGIARALVRLLSSPTHPLLWSVTDAPTPATTVTEERELRIDYILYQSDSLALTGVGHLPRLTAPIPDAEHPSDHLPVSARLVLRPHWARVEADARRWLATVSRSVAVRPLSGDALRAAFAYFDKDGSGLISLLQLEAGLQELGYPGQDSAKVREALRAAGCEESAGELGSIEGWSGSGGRGRAWLSRRGSSRGDRSWAMSLDQFIRVYQHCSHADTSSQARQLDLAFAALNPDHSGVVSRVELHESLRRMSSAPLDDARVDEVLRELEDGKGTISLASFTQWMARRYEQSLEDTSLIKDSMERAPEEMSDTEWMAQRYMHSGAGGSHSSHTTKYTSTY